MARQNVFPNDTSCPCFQCGFRTATCKIQGAADYCSKYAAWREAKDKQNAVITAIKKKDHALYETTFQRYVNVARRKNLPIRGGR